MSTKQMPPRKPWEDKTPEALPTTEAELLAEALQYADMIAKGEAELDKHSMAKAAAIEALYTSEVWVAEWMEANPPKKDAVGRPPVPNSRNRFAEWMRWRAQGRPTLGTNYINKLLRAQEINGYCRTGNSTFTEYTIRPLYWLLTNGPKHGETFADRIPQVERQAIEIAGSADRVTASDMRKAIAQFKKDIGWTRGDATRSKGERKAKRHSMRFMTEFSTVLTEDPAEAFRLIQWAAEQYKKANEVAA
jgi:hypothetical protein